MAFHLSYLGTAIATDQLVLFVDYITWAKTLFLSYQLRLEDLAHYVAPGSAVTALVARDRRLLRLRLLLPRTATTWRLTVRDGPQLARWLAG